MKPQINYLKKFTPTQILVFGYLFVTLFGALLLTLPLSSSQHTRQSFLDALFVATSGISTTGLTVVDIGSYYSLFGQIVLCCIFQIGGIGYMTFIIFLAYLLGLRTWLITETVAKESLSGPNYRTLGRFLILVVVVTGLLELTGGLILALYWMREFSFSRAVYFGLFHSISAFCTAGFSPFSTSLMEYRTSLTVNLTITLLSLFGGIGFFVLYDVFEYLKRKDTPKKLSLHTKIVLIVTCFVIAVGTIVIFLSEKWESTTHVSEMLLYSIFQSVSASTTDGFNTVDIGSMGFASLTIIMFLMFVGASPGSTGGGIKTSSLGVLGLFSWSYLKGRSDNISLFQRTIPTQSVLKAFNIALWFFTIILVDMAILSMTEKGSYLQILFETISALANTGLSMGITSNLSSIGKMVLIMSMFIGRIGLLTAGLFLIGKQKTLQLRYAEEDVFIG